MFNLKKLPIVVINTKYLNYVRVLIVLAFIILFFNINFSQSLNSLKINNFSVKSIFDIEIDQNGFLWIATYNDGLYKYDGTFLKNYIDTTELSTYHSRAICVNSEKKLFGTNEDLFELNGENSKRKSLFKTRQQVYKIKKIGRNDFLISTSIGFYRYKDFILRQIFSKEGEKVNTINNIELNFDPNDYSRNSFDDDNICFLAGRFGFYLFFPKTNLIQHISLNSDSKTSFYNSVICKDSVYVASSKGLYYYIRGEFKKFQIPRIGTMPIFQIYNPKHEEFLLLFCKDSLFKYYFSGNCVGYSYGEGIKNIIVNKVIEPKDNEIILATMNKGIFKINTNYIIKHYNDNIINIFKKNDSVFFFSTEHQIFEYNSNSKIEKLYYKTNDSIKISQFVIDQDDKIWIYTQNDKLFSIKNNIINYIKLEIDYVNKVIFNNISLSNDNHIWIGFSKECVEIDPNKTKIKYYSKGGFYSSSSMFISTFKRIKNEFYVLTGSHLLKKVNATFTPINSKILFVQNIEKDYKNNIWLKCFENFFLKKNGEFIPLQQKLNISVFSIKSIITYQNYLIIFSENYLHFLDLKQYYEKQSFDIKSIELKNYFNVEYIITNSNYLDNLGNLYFGTEKGLVIFNFLNEIKKSKKVKLNVSEILINYKSINLDSLGHSHLNENVPKKLTLKNYQNTITFKLSNLNFIDSDKITFEYILFGSDSFYKKISNLNQIEYSNLSPNKYKIQISAFYNGYKSSLDEIEYEFEIIPAFYQTKLFLMLTIGISLSVVVGIFNFRTKNIRKRNVILERIVSSKTENINLKLKEITKLYNEIKYKNNLINDSLAYAKNIQSIILDLHSDIKHNIFSQSNLTIKEILYSPKEVIGGDFYSIIIHNDLTIIICGDCTGHGVPGALLTIVCQIFLNQIIINENTTLPSDILYKLNNLIVKTFNKENGKMSISDGLAITILVINQSEQVLTLSESKQPFFIKYNDGTVKLLKSNSSSINYDIKQAKYFDIVEPLKTGTELILFSDGLIDQAGNNDSIRLGTYGLKKWIETIDSENAYSNLFWKWKGLKDQRDDVLLIHIVI